MRFVTTSLLAALAWVICRRRHREALIGGPGRATAAQKVRLGDASPGAEADSSLRRAAGVALMTITCLAAVVLLQQRAVPSENEGGIAFVGPVPAEATRAFALAMAVTVQSCREPVEVTVAAAGTADFWLREGRKVPRTSSVSFVIGDPRVQDVRVAPARDALEGRSPGAPRLTDGYTPLRRGEFKPGLIRRNEGTTVASAELRNWRRTWNPVLVTFRADWLQRRGLRSCYLRVPALTGPAATNVALQAAGFNPGGGPRRLRPALGLDEYEAGRRAIASFGRVEVSSLEDLDASSSQPPPTDVSSGRLVYSCAQRDFSAGETADLVVNQRDLVVNQRGQGAAFSSRSYRQPDFTRSGCDATVVVTDPNESTYRDLILLFAGVLLSFGTALFAGRASSIRGASGAQSL